MQFNKEKIDFSLQNINMTKDENGCLCLCFKILPEKKNDEIVKTLTNREIEILELVAQGKNNNQIAREIFVSVNTVKAHLSSIFQKLNVKDRVQAVVKAMQENII